jgi:hypothetical protein
VGEVYGAWISLFISWCVFYYSFVFVALANCYCGWSDRHRSPGWFRCNNRDAEIEHPILKQAQILTGSDSRRGLFVRGHRECAESTGDVASLLRARPE